MTTLGSDTNFAKEGQDLADKSADRIQSGMRTLKESGSQAAEKFSQKVEDVRAGAGPAIGKAADQAQSVARQTMDSVGSAAEKVRSTVADVGETVRDYTQDNPIQALLLAAAVGALLGSMATLWSRARD